MKRILFLSSTNPFKTGGGSQATLAYLDSVLELYGASKVDVVIAEEVLIPEDYKSIKYVKIKKRGKFESVIQYSRGYLSRFTLPLIKYIEKRKNEYSLCIINNGLIAGKSVKHINKHGVKTIVIHHNNEVEYHLDNKTIESLGGRFISYINKAQKSSFLNSDLNLFLTNQDIKSFQATYGKQKGLNKLIGTYEMKNREKVNLSLVTKKYSIVVSGTLADYQTTVGIEDFYLKYFQITNRIIDDLSILFTGRSPSKRILEIQKENPEVITIIPNPDDILSIVQKGRIYLCPTNIGGGLKLRAMDGLKCNLPVLVHEISARGYDYFYDKPYFKIYNDRESFEKGLNDIIIYLSNSGKNNAEIQNDYYKYFGFCQGTSRMKNAIRYIC